MEALYKRFEKKGLVVLAVSDEDRETVASFLEKQHYTFPVLLDPGREANKAFDVEGIPKSFIFNADGKLVAQAMDMRSERQFLELLKVAGIIEILGFNYHWLLTQTCLRKHVEAVATKRVFTKIPTKYISGKINLEV